MSQEPHAHDDEGPIKTPKQLIVAVVLAFVLPVVIIVLLVTFVGSASKSSPGSDALSPEATAQRIMPVASVQIKAAGAAGAASGEDVYKAQCAACHATGALGAPKFGDAAAWGPRIAQGLEALWNSAMKGKGAMPPQGGGDFNGDEIKRAVVHLANAGGAKFTAPAAAAAPASEAATATATAAPTPVATTEAAASAVTSTPAAAPAAAPVAVAGAVPPLYQSVCAACHDTGVLNAPKAGDKAAWAPRLAAGVDGLTASAIKGKGAMPPKGGATNASDADIKQAVAYLVAKAK